MSAKHVILEAGNIIPSMSSQSMAKRYGLSIRSILIVTVLICAFFTSTVQTSFAQDNDLNTQTEKNWDELMHYALIGNFELASGYGQALLDLNPDAQFLLDLAESERYSEHYRNLGLLKSNTPLTEIAEQILALVEKGRYERRTDTARISAEIKRLSGTTRGRMLAVSRLKDSGEWAIPLMIEAMRDPSRTEEISVIRWAMPQIGEPAVNPLIVALQYCPELNIRLIILDTLGKIGYKHALPAIQAILEDDNAPAELKESAANAFKQIAAGDQNVTIPASFLYERLAVDYYNHLPSLDVPANQELANVWFWDDKDGLIAEQVPSGSFDELMTMRYCELAVSLDPTRSDSIGLWISAFFRFEAEGYTQPQYFGNHPDASTYALTAGPEYLHRTLARALENQNRPVALMAIQTLQRNAGQQSLLFELNGAQPLMDAMSNPDREIRFSAALAIGGVVPANEFNHSEYVVPILAEALSQNGQQFAIVADRDQQSRNEVAAKITAVSKYAQIISDEFFSVAVERSRRVPSVDLIVLSANIVHPDVKESLELIKKDYRLAFTPVVVLADDTSLIGLKKEYEDQPFVEVLMANSTAEEIIAAGQAVLTRNNANEFASELADQYASAAANVLVELAVTSKGVLSLETAEETLINAMYDTRLDIKVSAIVTLAHMDSMTAQRALSALALDETIDKSIRLLAFENLAVSAKQYGNLLLAEQIDTIYNKIILSLDYDAELRNKAAQAYGALNLPSETISQLILSQSRPGK